jgi:hypothetical protein
MGSHEDSRSLGRFWQRSRGELEGERIVVTCGLHGPLYALHATYCQNHSFARPTFLSILTHLHSPQLKLYRYGERLVDRIDFEELALKSIDPSLGPKLSSPDFAGSRHEAKAEDADALQIKVSNIPLDPSFLNFTFICRFR